MEMEEKLLPFVIEKNTSILEALKKIDQNAKGFLIVLDRNGAVLGTLTDGDIRRAFIKGLAVGENISNIYTREFRFLRFTDGVAKAIEMFKSSAIKFLPIVDESKRLINIITKRQLHALLLQDIQTDLGYDFSGLDEGLIDYEIFQRPWGFYKTTVMNDYFQSKVISVKPKGQLSLQSHKHREEYWIVAHGSGIVQLEQSVIEVKCGSSIFIPKGCRHRLVNTGCHESLIITEVQIGDYFGEDDITRYEDLYGRVQPGEIKS